LALLENRMGGKKCWSEPVLLFVHERFSLSDGELATGSVDLGFRFMSHFYLPECCFGCSDQSGL